MTAATKDVRRRLKSLAKLTTDELFKVPPPERKPTREFFDTRLTEEIETRERREEVQRLIDDGCPNVQDDD